MAEASPLRIIDLPPPSEHPPIPPLRDLAVVIREWENSTSLEVWEACAEELAQINTPEAVTALLEGVYETADWEARVRLAQNLRALSNPEVVQSLIQGLLMDFGRGSPVIGEICDAISRLAQADTVTQLEAYHWQLNGQGVASHHLLRAMAGIRNPPARRALNKLAMNESVAESLRLAARDAINEMAVEAGETSSD